MEGSPCDCPDWAHLPLTAVLLISEKVKSITDYVRFRAVCSPWRSASLPKPRHLPPQLPWLMIPCSPNQEWLYRGQKDDGVRLFYDLWESKMRKLHLPDICGMMCCASYRGWLLLLATGGTEVFLLNPLSRNRIQLPPFTTPLKNLWVRDDWDGDVPDYDARHCFEPFVGDFAITRVTFSADLTDPNCLITVFLPRCWGIFCCRVGDPCWTLVNIRPDSSEFADATCYNGRFYLLYKGVMSIIDPNKPEERVVCLLKELREGSMFLLEEESGVYVVTVNNVEEEEEARSQKDDPSADDTKEGTKKTLKQKIEVYQFQEQPWKLKKITDTSNTTIFFGDNYHGLGVCSDDWDSLDGGSLYMEHKCVPYARKLAVKSGNSIHSAQLADGNLPLVHALVEDDEEPQFQQARPAMWFQPSYF